MQSNLESSYSTFDGFRLLKTGSLLANALAVRHATTAGASGPILTFDDHTGRTVDFDTRGSDREIAARFGSSVETDVASTLNKDEAGKEAQRSDEPRGRGRPKLGVVAREVTLLPRHWEWLGSQPGGASVALRKLVEEARKTHADRDRVRSAHERAYQFMHVIAGNFPGYEEATRALFANDRVKLSAVIEAWPKDVREHAIKLAFG